jgi:DNA repair protein RadC
MYATKLSSSRDAKQLLTTLFDDEVSESFLVLHLDTKLRILGFHVAARGGVSSCSVKMVDIFREAIASGANSIIIAHNHPSDDPSPSEEDLALTKRVKKASELLGIELLDHIIVAGEHHYSFLDVGLFSSMRQ